MWAVPAGSRTALGLSPSPGPSSIGGRVKAACAGLARASAHRARHARDDQLPPPHGAQSSGSAPGRSHRRAQVAAAQCRRAVSRARGAVGRPQSPRTTSPPASTVAGTGASEMVTRNSPAVRPGPVSCTSPTSAGATRQVERVAPGRHGGHPPRHRPRLALAQRSGRPRVDVGRAAPARAPVDDPDGPVGIGEAGLGARPAERHRRGALPRVGLHGHRDLRDRPIARVLDLQPQRRGLGHGLARRKAGVDDVERELAGRGTGVLAVLTAPRERREHGHCGEGPGAHPGRRPYQRHPRPCARSTLPFAAIEGPP